MNLFLKSHFNYRQHSLYSMIITMINKPKTYCFELTKMYFIPRQIAGTAGISMSLENNSFCLLCQTISVKPS